MIYFRGMKNALQITVFLLLVSLTCKSQEYFIGKTGDTTFCDIIYVTPLKFGYLNGEEVEHINRDSVLEVFRQQTDSSDSSESTPSEELIILKNPKVDIGQPIKPRNHRKAQQLINVAGKKLEQSRTLFYIGLACQVVGGGIIALSALPNNRNPNTTLIIGGTVAGAGSIVAISAFIPIGKAGIELQKVRLQ
jgi:hypothetical protein